MLTPIQADGVVQRCIRNTSNNTFDDIRSEKTLRSLGYTNSDRISILRNAIVNSDDGVKKENHKLKSSDLGDMAPEWTVADTRERVREEAKPIEDE
jgi:hypothetical protein